MKNSVRENSKAIDFRSRYVNYTDAQILEILKNKKGYQENARNAAIEIAVERQLINSGQDLLSPEFQNSKDASFTLFPQSGNIYQHKKLTGSIFRSLYILSLLPILYGVLKYSDGSIDLSIWGVSTGLVWLLLVVLLKRTQKPLILVPLFVILFLVGSAICIKIASVHPARIFDFVVLIIALLLSIYFLIFAKKLIQNKPENNGSI